jgi:hypothetical protein
MFLKLGELHDMAVPSLSRIYNLLIYTARSSEVYLSLMYVLKIDQHRLHACALGSAHLKMRSELGEERRMCFCALSCAFIQNV